MHRIQTSLRQAGRRLARTPLFTAAALVTLAVAIGANTAIFSVVNGVLLKPLPWPQPERLVGLWQAAPGLGLEQMPQSPATYLTYRSESRVLDDAALWNPGTVAVTGPERPERVDALMVTDGFLPILGVQPVLGRRFTPDDDSPGTPLTIMLGHGYWQRAFGGDREVIGETVAVNGTPYEVIGVLPRDFRFMGHDPAIMYPARFDPAQVFVGNFSFRGIGRLRPGSMPEQLATEMDRLLPLAVERYPGPISLSMMEQAGLAALVRPLKEDVVGDVGSVLWVLLGTVGMVLLIACANVANLFLVRGEGRTRDVAVRTALGARRREIAGQFLGESVLLGLAAGAAGLALAWGGIRLLLALSPALPRLEEIGLDPAVLGFTLVISVLAGLVFGAFPLLRYGHPDLVSALKEGGRSGSAGRQRQRVRSGLVVAQVALALVLLVGSGLMVRSFQALRSVDPGFERPEEVLTFRVSIPGGIIEEDPRAALAHQEIHERLLEIPGVVSVGASSSVTLDRYDSNDPVWVEGMAVEPGQIPPVRRMKWVYPGYFETMGNRLVAGRTLTWSDLNERAPVAVVTESLARELWGDPRAALGRRIAAPSGEGVGPWREVVGVVGDVHDDGVDKPTIPVVYWPAVMRDLYGSELFVHRNVGYVVRTRAGSPMALLPQAQGAVWAVNSALPLADARSLQELLDRSMARTSFTLVMLAIAAAVALLLGAVGIYGVISYTVTQRQREIGIRMALGALGRDVSRMVVRQGMALTGLGLLVGLAGAFAVTRVMSSLLFGVAAVDPLTYVAVAVALGSVALLASWLPARRAAAVDPAITLREE